MALHDTSTRYGALGFRKPQSIPLRQTGGVLFLSLLLPLLVGASFRADPCCGVIGVDLAKGFATIRDNKTGRTWQFEAGDATLSSLKIGSEVDADQAGGTTVSVAGIRKPYALNEPYPALPCCGISQVHLAEIDGGIVVRNKTTGATHHVTVGNQSVLAGLKVGQDVAMDAFGKWALLQANVDGKAATFSFPVSAAAKPGAPAAPCCGVVGIDVPNGIVTIRDNTTGLTLQFEAGAQAIRTMKEGDDVIVGTRPGAPETRESLHGIVLRVGSVARSYTLTDVVPIQPCCAVSVINGGVTTVDKVTGATHHITIDNAAARAAIKVGQDVSMDASGRWATFRLVIDGSPATYSFPVEGAIKKPGPATESIAPWEIRPNAELKGALGLLFFGISDRDAGTAAIVPAGQTEGSQTVFVDARLPLPPGKYDVNVSGAIVKNVPIESGMETGIRLGVLNLSVGGDIFDSTRKIELKYSLAGKTILPIGTYFIKVNSGWAKVVIKEKQVTEF